MSSGLGTHHFISGGGGGGVVEKNEIYSLSPQTSEKKFVENVGRKKKFVVEIDEKYVTTKNTKC